MSTFVTVNTSATSSVLVPFTSAANAAIAQAALDATDNKFIKLAPELVTYYSPADSISGSGGLPAAVTVPATTFFGAVANTNSNTLNFGAFDSLYNTMVTGAVTAVGAPGEGGGKTVLVGSSSTSVWSGANASLVYLNTNAAGAVFLGGNSTTGDAVDNAFNTSRMTIYDGAGTSTQSLLVAVDTVGGGATVHTSGNALIQFISGGSDMVIADGGITAVYAQSVVGAAGGVLTVSAATAGTVLKVGAAGAPVIIMPGAGDAFIFQGTPGQENSATLFGGTRVINGGTITAPAYTGRTTVLSGRGYFEAGSAGGSILQTGTTTGAATLVAGGTGDTLFLHGVGDTAILGNVAGVLAVGMSNNRVDTVGGALVRGDKFLLGSGSGTAWGANGGYSDFTFTGAGTYTLIGGHDLSGPSTSAGFIHGSVYHEASTAGGGHLTIIDFVPQQIFGSGSSTTAGSIFDRFDLGNASVISLTSTVVGSSAAGTLYDDTGVLSDGTTIVFKNTLGQIHQSGTSLI